MGFLKGLVDFLKDCIGFLKDLVFSRFPLGLVHV